MNLNALFARKAQMVARADALPGRAQPIPTAARHFVSGAPLAAELPPGAEQALFGMGCFWGAERLFWQQPGVLATMSGYAGGFTPNPTYEEVCSGRTGHAEVVRVVYDPARTDYATLLRLFWESHDPTQGLRQGNDIGSQYRSALYTFSPGQQAAAEASRDAFAARLRAAGLGAITTEIAPAGPFYMAEDHHQQYLARNPAGYCGLQGTGVSCPVGVTA